MCMDTSPNVLERLKLPGFKGIYFFSQPNGVTQGDKIMLLDVTELEEKRFISRSSSTSFREKFRRLCNLDFRF